MHIPLALIYRSLLLPYSETFIRDQVSMLSSWKGRLIGERLMANGLTLDPSEVKLLGLENKYAQKLVSLTGGLYRSSVLKKLRSEGARLLHIHFASDAYTFWPVAERLDMPVLITLHGFDITTNRDWWEAGCGGVRMKKYPSGLLKIADDERVHFLAVSEAIRNQAIAFGIPESKITVSYIGVDTRRFAPGNTPIKDRREILFVGRLVEKKGCQYLLRAFAQIQDEFPEFVLSIVGDGPLREELKCLARKLEVRAQFLGVLSSDQVQNKMDQARVLCVPSVTANNGDAEGMGMVILEAQACGVPVITSARGGAEEAIINGQTGLSHAEKDVSSMKDALTIILSDDNLAASYGANGREFVVGKMDLKKCVATLELVYESHASRR